MNEARQKAANPQFVVWGETRSLLKALKAAPDPEDARLRLRSALRRIIDSIWLLVVGRGSVRLAAAQCWFQGGKHRDYLIMHKGGNGVAGRLPQRWCDSLASVDDPQELDLRRREDAEALAEVLAEMDLTEFATDKRRF